MRPSDFPRGPDGVRFRVVRYRTGDGGPFSEDVRDSNGWTVPPDVIASALNQVAEWGSFPADSTMMLTCCECDTHWIIDPNKLVLVCPHCSNPEDGDEE